MHVAESILMDCYVHIIESTCAVSVCLSTGQVYWVRGSGQRRRHECDNLVGGERKSRGIATPKE